LVEDGLFVFAVFLTGPGTGIVPDVEGSGPGATVGPGAAGSEVVNSGEAVGSGVTTGLGVAVGLTAISAFSGSDGVWLSPVVSEDSFSASVEKKIDLIPNAAMRKTMNDVTPTANRVFNAIAGWLGLEAGRAPTG
jgi:hypothetical protein